MSGRIEERRKIENALWRNEGNGSEWRNGRILKEMNWNG